MSSSAVASGMLDMNHVDFDFNLPFEQLFLSIIPSALFILSTSWRIVRQFRKPNVINARAFQLIKLVRQDRDSEPICVWLITFLTGGYNHVCWSRIDSACSVGRPFLPSHNHVFAVSSSQARIRIVHGCFEFARPQQKLSTFCSAQRLSLLNISVRRCASKNPIPSVRDQVPIRLLRCLYRHPGLQSPVASSGGSTEVQVDYVESGRTQSGGDVRNLFSRRLPLVEQDIHRGLFQVAHNCGSLSPGHSLVGSIAS